MKNNLCRAMLIASVGFVFCTGMAPADEYIDNAKAYIAKITSDDATWTGPTTGPAAQNHKFIVLVNQDQRNSGGRGVLDFVAEAAGVIGWTYRIVDGQGTIAGQTSAINQAIALKPNGIVLVNVDAKEHDPEITQATAQGIRIVSWHASAIAGKSLDSPIFTNVTADPAEVARATALYAVADSNGTANVVLLTDNAYQIAVAKTNAAKAAVEGCKKCTVLAVYDSPFSEINSRMTALVRNTKAKYKNKWTYTIAPNDLWIDFVAPELQSEGVPGEGPPKNISGGDGSESAFQRIERNEYQVAVIAEAMRVDGFQIIDELNRAFANQAPSGFVAPIHLITLSNVHSERGKGGFYDPSNGYEKVYRRIWGK
jgi:ribose transport system substrate-binding protein